jgi:predicted nucleic acid-binding protein
VSLPGSWVLLDDLEARNIAEHLRLQVKGRSVS